MARILIVDDDATLTEVVTGYLARTGHEVASVADGASALRAVRANPPDLVVLDIMLPEVDGLEVCRQVRRTAPEVLVIILTALAGEDDRIAGLETGADDYLTKPFSPRELVLRVESLLRRRTGTPPIPGVLRAGDVTVEPSSRRATRADTELALTVREFDLLAYLMARPGVAFSRNELMAAVWGWTFGDQSTVTVHVRRLREKIEVDPSDPKLIHTVWGVGYRMEPT